MLRRFGSAGKWVRETPVFDNGWLPGAGLLHVDTPRNQLILRCKQPSTDLGLANLAVDGLHQVIHEDQMLGRLWPT